MLDFYAVVTSFLKQVNVKFCQMCMLYSTRQKCEKEKLKNISVASTCTYIVNIHVPSHFIKALSLVTIFVNSIHKCNCMY